jgi:hypothetical protein
MKKILFSLLALFATCIAQAQTSIMATLTHNGKTTIYYGADALVEAAAASAYGDRITLTSGVFNAPTLTKAVSICGAGMEPDTINHVEPTTLRGKLKLAFEDSLNTNFSIDRVLMPEGMFVGNATVNASYTRCKILGNGFDVDNTYRFTQLNSNFVHCVLSNVDLTKSSTYTFLNSVLFGLYMSVVDNPRVEMKNCIVLANGEVSSWENVGMENCIYAYTLSNYSGNQFTKTTYALNCLAISSNSDPFKYSYNTTNYVFKSLYNSTIPYGSVFKTFRGDITKDSNFELTEEAKTKYLGTDGKEIGIYGGYTYKPTSSSLNVRKFKVADKTNAEGKLQVEIVVGTDY